MTHFTTSKGELIAVPIPERALTSSFDKIRFILDIQLYFGEDVEIIGLSSDILKDEELAKKIIQTHECINGEVYQDYVVNGGKVRTAIGSASTCFKAHNITGNQLIIRKK